MRFLVILLLFFSFFSASKENEKIKEYPKNELIVKVFKKNNNNYKDSDINNLISILNYIDSNEIHTPYKKHLLKNLSMLNYKAFLMVGEEKELVNIAKYIFPTSMCAAYQFRNDLMRLLKETSQFFIKSEDDLKLYELSFIRMQKLYLDEANENFNPEENFFVDHCSY